MNIIIIPARLDSKRLPRKLLLEAGGKSILQWTFEAAERTQADRVYVATSDDEIEEHCGMNKMRCVLTGSNHLTGTGRCAEAAQIICRDDDLIISRVVNLQADEPGIPNRMLDLLFSMNSYDREIYTLVGNLSLWNGDRSDIVKAAVTPTGQCFWFSRAPMLGSYHHIGVYSFIMDRLQSLTHLNLSQLSMNESLEQLTWIEAGYQIKAFFTEPGTGLSINSKRDFDKFKKLVEA